MKQHNPRFTRKLLVAAITATACATSMAADKAPTFGDVLKASGVDISGYVDVTYTKFDTDAGLYHAYTTETDSFNLNAVDLAVSKLPAAGVGGMVEVMAGEDPLFNRSRGWTTDNFDVLQAFAQYAGGGFTVLGGKFTTLAGAEVAQQPNNANISRSLLYTLAIPVTHTGLRASYAPSDTLKLTAGYNNGWDIIKESVASNCLAPPATDCADGKTIELGVSATPIKMLSLAAAYYTGEELATTGIDTRNLLDIIATLNLTDALSIVLNYDLGEQEKGTAAGGKAKWDGLAGYVNYKFSDAFRASLRAETFDDQDGYRTGTVQKLDEYTLTVGYSPAANLELRAELRQDKSDKNVFSDGGNPTDKQQLIALEAVYKF
jgi:hypothetical protein